MFNKIKPYMGNYIRYTYAALCTMLIALIAYMVPFFMAYRIIRPLIDGEQLSAGYLVIHIAIIFACELVYAYLYVLGLKFSYISAFNTLKNLRISLQKKLERQPLGTIHDMGNGKIKKLFTDDIDQVELLLAHAIPEGIANLSIGVPLLKALNFAGKFPQLNYKVDEIEKAMDNEPLKTNNAPFSGDSHIVKFEDVHFAYKEQEVLHGVSLELGEGTFTALGGESGSGKSTLAKLLVHYYDLNGGRITLGGQDITDMRIEALNDQISYISQEQFLFNTMLYNNILIGRLDATREEVMAAAEKAQCSEFLARLPKGIDTMAGDGGKQLSGGERQRISLARAILKNAPVIVLDAGHGIN